ncbi:DUF4974 domain-containing protein [Flavivirga aquimarina]|uniref:DUF4974 domain-containing protein n=1 Tax=Flavivirga aquimarina TaxID=2027862 RepID=A0ABT8W8S8_9FLAO|nr:FecR domain-containing protein [Flavivirga aquimarina]MDO5969531.1 DUF4974 domain-containing protein [Flavivirga aquimarina]
MENTEIEHIIAKSFTKVLKKHEQVILNEWIGESSENRDKYDNYKQLWEKSGALITPGIVDVEAALTKTKKRIGEFHHRKRRRFYAPAAVITLLISIAFLVKYAINSNVLLKGNEEIVFQEVKAAYGTKTKLLLADGTNIWLNSGSTLRFPISFNKAKERRVYLDGEGYFEVAKDESKPFFVNTKKVNVKVHGTSFNVSSYDDYNSMSVALVDGKVSLIQKYQGKQKDIMELKSLDVATCNFEKGTINRSSETKIEKYTSWKDGYMVFYGDSIDYIIKRLERWYNIDIVIEDEELLQYAFTATFRDEPLEQMLDLLGLSSPMEYKIIPSRKLNDNTFSVRKVILSKKRTNN